MLFKSTPKDPYALTTFEAHQDFPVAPDDLYALCTDPHKMQQWFSPAGVKNVTSVMDAKEGGFYHYGLKNPNGSVYWGLWRFRKLRAPDYIEFLQSFSDENRGVTQNPMLENWPLVLLSSFSFEPRSRRSTRFTVRWMPWKANPAEIKSFNENFASMTKGWKGTLGQCEAYLKQRQQDRLMRV